jgi:hypothetical protein
MIYMMTIRITTTTIDIYGNRFRLLEQEIGHDSSKLDAIKRTTRQCRRDNTSKDVTYL